MKKNRLFSLQLLFFLLLQLSIMTSCSRQIDSDVYSAESIGSENSTYPGVILQARTIQVQEGEYLGDNKIGGIGGGVGGAMIGSQIGHGTGNSISTAVGAILGATIGAFSEKGLKKQTAMEYIVELDNGEVRTVVQGIKPLFSEGQKIWLISNKKATGRARITARQ